MATTRTGKPYIWATWLAKLLGGNECVWSAWFKAHHRYEKFEEMAADLAEWNREHNELMRRRRLELEREGYTVFVESQNDFKIEGAHAVVAGKPDIVAVKPGSVLIVDGKTGKRRDSDVWQVLLYLFAWPTTRTIPPDALLEGEVQYKRGDERLTVMPADLTPERQEQLITLIKTIANPSPPRRVPSRFECRSCNIGPRDCPERVQQDEAVATTSAF